MTLPPLQIGDCLLYSPKGFFGALIAHKSWHRIAHVEIFVGAGQSVASRDGKGVGRYPLRDTELAHVLRPIPPLNMSDGLAWFKTVNGQPYDMYGLLRFVWTGSIGSGDNGRMFCSEFATRFYRQCGMDPFNEDDADAIAPFQFLTSNCFRRVAPVVEAISVVAPA